MSKIIVNCETGEIIERDLNEDELNQQAIDKAESDARKAEIAAKEAQRNAIAERLGLSAEELKVLLG